MDIYQLRFLESAEIIKALARLRTGRELSTSRAREITACIQQGRQFFEAAPKSPLEIRPLVQFYGMLGFARALVISRRGVSLSTLSKGHGVRDISAPDARIAELRVRLEAHGTFAEFNDEVAALNRVCFFAADTQPTSLSIPCAPSSALVGFELTLKDILARVPRSAELFRRTYNHPPASESLDSLYFSEGENRFVLRLVDPDPLASREALRAIVERWRLRFPYLRRWRVVEAAKAWGDSYITVANVPFGDADDLSPELLPQREDGQFHASAPLPTDRHPPQDILLGVGGGYSEGPAYGIESINGQFMSEFSYMYLALFLLSSLVRYRPDIWAHAVSRSSLQDRPVDDQPLALVESFLEQSLADVSRLVVQALNPHEDRYA